MRWLPVAVSLVLGASSSAATAHAQAEPASHSVQPGETLRSIAEEYGLSSVTIVAANNVADPDRLQIGQELVIPPMDGVLHTVQAGETLHGIAERYDVSSIDLARVNGLDGSPDDLLAGVTLTVPGLALAEAAANALPAQGVAAATATPATPVPAPAAIQVATATPAAPVPAPAPIQAAPANVKVFIAAVTGYAPGAGAVSSRTASGTVAHWGTVAADTRLYPFGTRMRIEGLADTIFVVEDTGSAVHGNVLDVWCPDAASASSLGGRPRQVTILGPDGA